MLQTDNQYALKNDRYVKDGIVTAIMENTVNFACADCPFVDLLSGEIARLELEHEVEMTFGSRLMQLREKVAATPENNMELNQRITDLVNDYVEAYSDDSASAQSLADLYSEHLSIGRENCDGPIVQKKYIVFGKEVINCSSIFGSHYYSKHIKHVKNENQD